MLTIQNFATIHPEAKIEDNVHMTLLLYYKNVEMRMVWMVLTIMEGAK